jgi:acetyltransferase-like isoleucine patch superfamily enzyme
MIRSTISAVCRVATSRHYRAVRIGAGSRVDFWKLKAKTDNRIEVGANSMFASRVVYERPGAELCVGARTFVGLGLMSIAQSVYIGDDVLVSWGATIVDHHSHSLRARERKNDVELWIKGVKEWSGIRIEPVRVENRAWLGFNVSLLAGVVIGEGAIVGAGSLVTKSVPSWTIAAGNPARVIRELTADERW